VRGGGEVCEEVIASGAAGSAAPGDGAPVLRRVLVIAVVLAALAAAALGALWALAATSGSLELARDRDAVLVDARQAAINLNTLDYRNAAAGLDLWQQSSTGQVLTEFEQNRDQYAKLVQESRRATVATVPAAVVTELDEQAGVARVLSRSTSPSPSPRRVRRPPSPASGCRWR
jgi:Mce-associated membrane protein